MDARAFSRMPLKGLLLLPLVLLGLFVAAGAELDAALAGWLAGMDPGLRMVLLANVMLAAVGLPAVCAAALLMRALWLRRDIPTEEGKS